MKNRKRKFNKGRMIRQFIAILLTCSIVFTSQASFVFAEGLSNDVETTSIEENIDNGEEEHKEEQKENLEEGEKPEEGEKQEEGKKPEEGEKVEEDATPNEGIEKPTESDKPVESEKSAEGEKSEDVKPEESEKSEDGKQNDKNDGGKDLNEQNNDGEKIATSSDSEKTELDDNNIDSEVVTATISEAVTATISEVDYVLDAQVATISEVDKGVIKIATVSETLGDDLFGNLFGRVPGDTWSEDHWDSTAKRANVAYVNNQDQVYGGELLRLWTFTGSAMSTSSYEADDYLEEVAPIGKKYWGVYEMGSSYDSKDAFLNDYNHTKNWDEALLNTSGSPYRVGSLYSYYQNQVGWDSTPKFYGVVYDDALTIKYITNLPTHEWDLDDESRWNNALTRWDLYQFIGSITPESREYCYRGEYLKSDEGTAITAHKYTGTDKLTLIGWNTKADGTGTSYELGEFIPDEAPFTNNHLTLYAVWQDSSLVKRVKYDSNIDPMSGYFEPRFDDSLTGDATNNPIVLVGNGIKTIKWNDFKEKTITKWNTAADGSGIDYAVGTTITDYSGFNADGVLQLYAIWSNPIDIKFGVNYEQNIPSGWTLQGTWDITNISNSSLPITLANGNGLSIKNDTTGDVRYLRGWIQESVSRQWPLGLEITADGWDKDELFRYGQETTPTLKALWQEVYAVAYQQNLGDYTLDGNWFNASMTENLEWGPITVSGSMDADKIKIGRKDNNIKLLTGWNTKADGTGTSIAFGETIDNTRASLFDTHKELKLYAQWEETEDAFYYTDGKPRIVIAYLDKDATTSTKEKIQVFDLSDTSITVDSIKTIINNVVPDWATVSGWTPSNAEDPDYAYGNITFGLPVKNIYGAKDVYRAYISNFRATTKLQDLYDSVMNYPRTAFMCVAYKVPEFNMVGRPGTGNTRSNSMVQFLYGETEQLTAYLNGQPYAETGTGLDNTVDTSYTGVFSVSRADWPNYMVGTAYTQAGGYADTVAPTIIGKDGILTAYSDWLNSVDEDTDDLFYPFSYMIPPFMYWYVDGDTLHFSNTDAADRTPITNDADGLVYTGLTNTSIKHVVVDDNITVTEARKFFYYFSNLEDITGMEKLNFSNATSLKQMFYGCTNLGTLDLSSMNTSSATDMTAMFSGCSNLEYLNLKSFNTSNVTNMTNMFYACTKLASIYVSDTFDVSNVTSSSGMFQSCSKLFGESGTEYDSSKKDKSYAHIDGGTANPGYFTTVPTYSNWLYWYFADNDLTLHLTNVASGHNNTFASTKANDKDQIIYEGLSYKKRRALTKVVFDTNINALAVRGMFNDFLNIEEIQDINKLNTSSAKDMSYMFHYCQKLKSINVSGFDTSNVTNMEYMFAYCNSDSLTSLDCSNFNTNKVTNMRYMFFNCTKATSIKVTNFDTSNVTLINNMFCSCNVVTTLNLSSFDTRNVTKSSYMFNGCLALQAIYVCDKFVLDNVTGYYDSQFMFSDCPNLVGAEGTAYDSTKTDKTYARIDEGATAPGYFSGPVADRSTLDTGGTPRLYVVAYNGSDATKRIHSVTKSDGATALTNILNSLEKLDPTCNINGYYAVISTTKDEFGHRVFLSEDDLKTKYNQAITTVEKTETQLLADYSTFIADTNVYDLYFGVIYSPFITQITGVTGITLPTAGTGANQITYYPVGGSTDLTGASITVELSDGTSNTITYASDPTNFAVVPATYSASDTTITLKYKGIEYPLADNLFVYQTGDTYDITSVNTTNVKTVYTEGDIFDATGLSVTAHVFPNVTTNPQTITYADHSSKFHIPTTPIALGDTSVTIKYGNYDDSRYNIPITVLKRGQSGEMLDDGKPAHNYYVAPHTLDNTDLAGLKIKVNYPAGSTPESQIYEYNTNPEYFEITPKDLTANDTKLTIKIAGTTIEYPIVVEPSGTPNSASKSASPTKTNYISGEAFDPTGLVLNVKYPGNVEKSIAYNDETKDNFTFSPNPFATPPETLAYGMTGVQVTYKGVTTNIPVTVKKEITSFTIIHGPSNTDYSKGDKFNPDGLVVHVTYTDSTTEDITYNDNTKGLFTFTPALDHKFDNTDVGNKVQVSIGGVTALTIDDMNSVFNDSVAAVSINSDGSANVKHNITRDEFIAALDEAISNGAIGFHEYVADGINNAKSKYNKYTSKTLTKDEAIAKYDEYVAGGLINSKFIGATYERPAPSTITVPTDLPIKKTYTEGDKFDPTGLEITATYEDGTVETIKYSDNKSNFTFNPSLDTKLTNSNKKVNISYKGTTTNITITVNKKIDPTPTPTPRDRGGSSSGGDSGGSSPSIGPMGDLTKIPAYANLNNPKGQEVINTTNIATVKNDPAPIDKTVTKWAQNPLTGDWQLSVSIAGNNQQIIGGFVNITDVATTVINNQVTAVAVVDTYYIDSTGKMLTGWLNTADSKTYYFETAKTAEEGKMAKGWKSIQNSWYYFNSDGAMLRTTMTPDGYYVGFDGRWIS